MRQVNVEEPKTSSQELWRPAPKKSLIDFVELAVKKFTAWAKYVGINRLVFGLLATVCVFFAGTWLFRKPQSPIESSLPVATTSTLMHGVAEASDEKILIHIAGAVRKPGVYQVRDGSRVVEIVYLAGGFVDDADQSIVNLAAKVLDEQQIFIPRVGEASRDTIGIGESQGSPSNGKVNLNRATATELESLPGIGPTTAEEIVAYREANGPFRSVDDLLRVRGIGDAKLDAIRELLSL